MADSLIFEASEFEVLETFDFEEEVRKSEESRFFTLDEQLTDYFEKTMPARKPTRFELQMLKNTKDRIKEVYTKLVTITDVDYVVNLNRKKISVNWVHPVYADFEYNPYAYETEWMPLFESSRRRTPNYYPQMLNALPRPFKSSVSGRPLTESEMLVDENGTHPINGLSNFTMTTTIINDDNTLDVMPITVANTGDDVKIVGFYLDERPYEIPRPMIDHPFLKSNKAGFVKTENTLFDVYPSISAIVEHAIPVTTDPYLEERKTLKLYDVRLSQIPWSSWKERFPPVELKNSSSSIVELLFKHPSDKAPGEILQKQYTEWHSGLNARIWLSRQIDAGLFVSEILLSESSSSGLLPASAPVEIPTASFPDALPEICANLSSNFDMFLSSGLYRPNRESLKCVVVPIGSIQQEKRDAGFKGRLVWKESTKHDILIHHQKLLKQFSVFEDVTPPTVYPKSAHQIKSERSKDIITILDDPERAPGDKADSIELIVRDLTLENRLYLDVTKQFVVCCHTLAVLHGHMEDRLAFYAEWTTTHEGSRICKYCGEEVNRDAFIAVTEYDEDGHVTMEYSALDQQLQISGNPVVSSLTELRVKFDMTSTSELLLFTILSFLQVLPKEEQIIPVIQLIRKLTAGLKSRAVSSKTITKEKQDLVEGILGIAGAVVLLQAHVPFLIPKRGIGNKPFNTSGFPRDSDDPTTCHSLDSILSILRKTFEAFPATYRGGTATVLRLVLKNAKELKEQSIQWIKIFADQFKTLFESARERYIEPTAEAPKNLIQLPIEKVDNPVFAPDESLGEEGEILCSVQRTSTIWMTKRIPSVRQKEIALHPKIEASPAHTLVNPPKQTTVYETVTDKDIRQRIALGLPVGFPMLSEFIKSADSTAFTALTSRFLVILSKTKFSMKIQQTLNMHIAKLNIVGSSSLARDNAKGFFFELMHAVKASAPATRTILDAIKTDLTIRMILLSEVAAEKEDFELRSKERNTFKSIMRAMSDTERETTQQLVALGIADFLITNKLREQFAREFNIENEEVLEDDNRPEEGYSDERDYVENGDQPIAPDGSILEVDHGEYGDRGVRDYNDYTAQQTFDEDS